MHLLILYNKCIKYICLYKILYSLWAYTWIFCPFISIENSLFPKKAYYKLMVYHYNLLKYKICSNVWAYHPHPLYMMLIVSPYNIITEILNNLQSSKEESITSCIMYREGQGSWLIHFKRVFNDTFWNQMVSCFSLSNWNIIYHNIPLPRYLSKLRFVMWFAFKNFESMLKRRLKWCCGMSQANAGLNLISMRILQTATAQQEKNLKRPCARDFLFSYNLTLKPKEPQSVLT